MTVFIVPKEQVAIVLMVDFDVARETLDPWLISSRVSSYPACIFNSGPSGAPGRDLI